MAIHETIVRLKYEVDKSSLKLQRQMNDLRKQAADVRGDRKLGAATRRQRLIPIQKKMATIQHDMNKGIIKNKELLAEQTKKAGLARREFSGYALSIMFAGMAIQRVFMGIGKAGLKTFREISESVEGTVTPLPPR